MIGDLEEVISTHLVGSTFSEYNKESYEEAINMMLELYKDPFGLRQRCRKTAEDLFSLEHGIDLYSQVYRSIIDYKYPSGSRPQDHL